VVCVLVCSGRRRRRRQQAPSAISLKELYEEVQAHTLSHCLSVSHLYVLLLLLLLCVRRSVAVVFDGMSADSDAGKQQQQRAVHP
jgi:hypothetical protein